ncbi:unnamed protein product [Caenorhabditis bovis]|uniref:Protein tweety homolog n=1 Tax=Caenorhabditis bovis TaxID=2654633 RepID=A0A8S1FDU6_9PELO|nr:unnamed protein product [Caenorhabditis bovis]
MIPMNIFPFLLLLLGTQQRLIAGETINCADGDMSVKSMKPSFGGISAFYSIAKGISDGLQSTPNEKTYKDLNNFIFDEDDSVTYSVVARDLILNQIGAIVFWSFGFVIILAALVLLVATAIWQCCFTCVPMSQAKRSPTTGVIYIGLLVTCFAFLLTGTILFNISIANLTSSIDRGQEFTKQISNDLGRVLNTGAQQMTCAVQTTTNNTFSELSAQIGNYAQVVIQNTNNQIGLTDLMNFNTSGFDEQIAETRRLQNSLNINCAEKSTISKQFEIVTENLNIFQRSSNNLDDPISVIRSELNTIQNQIQAQADQANQAIESSQLQISDSTISINNMIHDLQDDISNIVSALNTAQSDTVSSNAYFIVKLCLRLVVTVPTCVAMLFAIIAILGVCDGMKRSRFVGCTSKTILVGFYTILVFCIIILFVESAAFVAGWATSAVCVPIFEDPNYKLFHSLQSINIQTQEQGPSDQFNIGATMTSCTDPNETFYNAINASQIISQDAIDNQMDLEQYRTQSNENIQNYPFTQVEVANSSQLNTSLEELKNSLKILQGITNCANNNDYSNYLASLQSTINSASEFTDDVNKFNNPQTGYPNIQAILVQQNNYQFDQGQSVINGSVQQLTSELQTSIFLCRPLIDIFTNGGDVVCQQFGSPIQGMWSSVGLIGVVEFVLAIVFLCVYRWLSRNSPKSSSVSSWNDGPTRRDSDVFAKPPIRLPSFPQAQIEPIEIDRNNADYRDSERHAEEESWGNVGRDVQGLKRNY